MVLKFKVWRLQPEKRVYTRKGKKKKYRVWCLRDKEGHIVRVARKPEDVYRLRKRYKKYNEEHKLEQLLAVRRLKDHVRRIKAGVRKRGFIKQLSIYGITKNKETGKRVYRRYEIFKAVQWTQQEVAAIHDFFKKSPPLSHAGIFIYHNDKLLIVEGDKITQKGTSEVGYKGERRNLDVD
jgi:hypothetical protein